jgi:hypothetical protein
MSGEPTTHFTENDTLTACRQGKYEQVYIQS